MFENILHQNAADLLRSDILAGTLPGAILLAGPEAAGKLSCALETARVLSCTAQTRGRWSCQCRSCRRHRSLVPSNMLIVGARDCMTEIRAAKAVFLASVGNPSYAEATRFLFVRSVRKLTLRFEQVLWEDDDKLPKFSPALTQLNELLEELDAGRQLPEQARLEKKCARLEELCAKLEDGFLYDALPVAQVRRASEWARMTSAEGKKILIVENADRMQESARNAMLKILEEPPADMLFILSACRRGAVMQTILSRVRTYTFTERTAEQQAQVVERVFHNVAGNGSSAEGMGIKELLRTFLPVPQSAVHAAADSFFSSLLQAQVPDTDALLKACGDFKPQSLSEIFFERVMRHCAALAQKNPQHCAVATELAALLRNTRSSITVYNQGARAALEELSTSAAAVLRQPL